MVFVDLKLLAVVGAVVVSVRNTVFLEATIRRMLLPPSGQNPSESMNHLYFTKNLLFERKSFRSTYGQFPFWSCWTFIVTRATLFVAESVRFRTTCKHGHFTFRSCWALIAFGATF